MIMFQMSEAEFLEKDGNNEGACVKCGASAYNVEFDARRKKCWECGLKGVYSVSELLYMGQIEERV